MKVAVISNYFPPDFVGGAEIYAHRLAGELVKTGVDVSVITSTKTRREMIELEGMRIFKVTKAPPQQRLTGNLFGYNFNPWSYPLEKALKRILPEVIHIHNINSTIMLYPLTRFLNSPTVVHVHDHWPICYTGTLYNMKRNKHCDENCSECAFRPGFRTMGNINLKFGIKLIAQFEEKVNLFITPSNYLREKLIEKEFTQDDKIVHIPLGIDLEEFSTRPEKSQRDSTILFIGRLAPYKNPSLLIKILPKILKHTECKFQIVGKGPEREKLKKLSVSLGVDRHVEVLSGIETSLLIDKIRSADVLVVPSVWPENSPVVIYEALACGTPAIVSNLGGAKELIDEGKSGFSIDPTDEKGWIERILKIITDKDSRRKMGIEARKKAEREYDIRKNAEKIFGVYETLTNTPTRR